MDSARSATAPAAAAFGPMLLTEIDHVAIAVHDLEAAIASYPRRLRRRGTLIELVQENPGAGH